MLQQPLSSHARIVMNGTHTPTALRRWSCQDKILPPVADIKYIHVYDFGEKHYAIKILWYNID